MFFRVNVEGCILYVNTESEDLVHEAICDAYEICFPADLLEITPLNSIDDIPEFERPYLINKWIYVNYKHYKPR